MLTTKIVILNKNYQLNLMPRLLITNLSLEWKGEDRVSNKDTKYKVEIGDVWAKLGGGKLHFFLVHNGNIEKTLNTIKRF